MIGGWQITPLIILQPVHEKNIIDGIRVFVEKDKDSSGIPNLRELEKLRIKWIETVGEFSRVTNHRIHGHATYTLSVRSGFPIRGAFVNLWGAIVVWSEFGFGQVNCVRVIIAIIPILHVVGPGIAARHRFRFAMVVHQQIEIIISIQEPGERELFYVTVACNCLSFRLGCGQCRQEQSCQDGDIIAITTKSSTNVNASVAKGDIHERKRVYGLRHFMSNTA